MRGKSIEAVGKSAIAMPVVRERLDWLDALKGIGIIAVVAGHIWTRGAFRNGIYSFHMPLFFMASGAVARAVPTRILAPRLLLALGLPALSFAVLFLGLDFLIEGARHVRPIFPNVPTGIWTILTGTERLRGPLAILWFAPCLIMARLAWNSLQHRLDPMGFRMTAVMVPVLLIALLVDRFGAISPLGLLPVPGALIFIWLGYRWKDRRPGLFVSAVTLVLAALALIVMPPLNMRAGDLGWPLLGIAGAAAIVDRIAWVTRRLPGRLTRALAWIGRNSLIIMFLHLCFAHYLAPYFPKFVLLALGVAGPLLIGMLMRRNRLTKLLFLGER
ncbi:MAG: acyltransferase family protein [Sphingobium sp.]|nr:acyltransferase family protein [Sphingobium sp.]